MTEYILDAVQEQFYAENGKTDLALPRGDAGRPLHQGDSSLLHKKLAKPS